MELSNDVQLNEKTLNHSGNKAIYLWMINKPVTSFSNSLLTAEKALVIVFSQRPLPNILLQREP